MSEIDQVVKEQETIEQNEQTEATHKKKYIKQAYVKNRENSHIPHDPEYFVKYYKENLSIKVVCDICSANVTKGNLSKHKKTKGCQGANKIIVKELIYNV